ncbi:protein of unknown function (plasmid) [Paraburkholderia kururiensis]
MTRFGAQVLWGLRPLSKVGGCRLLLVARSGAGEVNGSGRCVREPAIVDSLGLLGQPRHEIFLLWSPWLSFVPLPHSVTRILHPTAGPGVSAMS